MSLLDEVSETALITIRSRVVESEKKNPLLRDPAGADLFGKLLEILSGDVRQRILERKLSPVLTSHIALRARKYDRLCLEFLEAYPDGIIVNLGCGFDTRFWRLGAGSGQYVELDLPAVIGLKRELLGKKMPYRTMAGSVLEPGWIGEVKEIRRDRVLFIAEGLFMYLPREQVIHTLQEIAGSFTGSRLVMEVVAEKYTRGFRRRMVERKMRKGAGSTAGDYYRFGIRRAEDLETFHDGYRLRGEWSYFEDPDIKPAFLKLFRYSRALSKTQYTVIADIS